VERTTLRVPLRGHRKVVLKEGRTGEREGRRFFLGFIDGAPERPETQESRRLDSGLNLRRAKSTAFQVGVNRWSAGYRPGGLYKERRSGEINLKGLIDHLRGGKL
jgi:hypothetical protein